MSGKSIWAIAAGVNLHRRRVDAGGCRVSRDRRVSAVGSPIDDKLAVLATSYRTVISVAGAWLTARLAPSKPMEHAMILGFVGMVMGTIGVVVTWNMGMGPRWYPIALAALGGCRSAGSAGRSTRALS
jgi:hypothetical protein